MTVAADPQGTPAGSEGQKDPQEGQNGDNPEVAALAAQLKREQDARRRFEGKVADYEVKFKEFEGIDPTEVRKIIEDKQRLEEEVRKKDPTKLEEHYKQEIQRKVDGYEGKIKEREARIEQLERINKTLTVTDKVMANISRHFNDDVLDIVKTIVEKHCDLADDGSILIRDEKGEEMSSPKNRMIPITVEEFGLWLAEKKPSLAKATGMGGTNNGTGEKARRTLGKLPGSMQEIFSMPNGREVWAKLSAEEKAQLGATWKFG